VHTQSSLTIQDTKCFAAELAEFVSFFSEQLSEQEDLIVWMRTAALPTSFTIYWVHFSSQKG
jgi:hypothetical protein